MTHSKTSTCPCGNLEPYMLCCGLYIEEGQSPQTPEQLMRSRYTAFTQANTDYIGKTMCHEALKQYDATATRAWALSVQWDRLEVLCAPPVAENASIGIVHFIAHYLDNNLPNTIEEWSEFKFIENQWYYTNSVKINRNDLCLCESGKKYKKCCGLSQK